MLIVHLVKKDAPQQAIVVIGAAGSFAAISTLLGSPLIGAFLLMEVAGIAGPMIGVILLPGLLAAGIGSLVFLGPQRRHGLGHLLPRHPQPAAVRLDRRLPVPVGHRHRRARRRGRHR